MGPGPEARTVGVGGCMASQWWSAVFQLYGFEGGLTLLEGSGQWAPVQRLVQPCSVACYKRDLLYPRYW